jgi:small subunit ribosomal protein S1
MVNTKTTVKDIGFTHEDFAALLDKYDYHFSPGDVVAGTVFSIEPRGALIDIGAKTAAYIPIQEMSINRVESPEEVLQSNETREFFILTDENEDGQLTLSIRRIEYMRAWERVRQLQAEDATVRSQVFATNRGGALVRIEGLRGFIPGSHISTRKPKEELVAEELPLKFLEVDEDRNRLVLSHRRALVERKMNRLEVGEVVIGTVRGIKPYGAFIDIGGVSGLLHISEISHDHIDTPHSVFNVNDEVKVMIIDLDAERGRISLSTKQLEPEPGAMVKNRELVYEKAEEMAAKFREKMLAQKQAKAGIDVPVDATDADELSDEILEDVPSAMEEDLPEETTAAVTEATPEVVTEATPEATPEPVTEATPEPVTEATPEPVAEATPEPVTEATPEPVTEATSEPVTEATPEATLEVSAEIPPATVE